MRCLVLLHTSTGKLSRLANLGHKRASGGEFILSSPGCLRVPAGRLYNAGYEKNRNEMPGIFLFPSDHAYSTCEPERQRGTFWRTFLGYRAHLPNLLKEPSKKYDCLLAVRDGETIRPSADTWTRLMVCDTMGIDLANDIPEESKWCVSCAGMYRRSDGVHY